MGSVLSRDNGVKAVSTNVEMIWNRETRGVKPSYRRIGSSCNDWRMPVSIFVQDELCFAERLRENKCIGEYEISDALWQKSCGVVEEISEFFQAVMNKVSSRCFPCLIFEDLVKQGSSREGLKIRRPDEFGMILPFSIDGVDIHSVPVLDSYGERIPGLVNLQIAASDVENVMNNSKYKSLRMNGVFQFCDPDLFLNAICFQTGVIPTIMETTVSEIQKSVSTEIKNHTCSFTLSTTSAVPPSYRFKIVINLYSAHDHVFEITYPESGNGPSEQGARSGWRPSHKVIEFEIVPGLIIQSDSLPDPDSWFCRKIPCRRYAVLNILNLVCQERCTVDSIDRNLLWRESTAGYEMHIIDISRNLGSLHILTACRIMKAYIDGMDHSSQLRSLLTSYHLKNVAIHLILLQIKVSGVKQALGYFMVFLDICLEMEFLPHFFYGNPNLSAVSPKLQEYSSQKRLNLFNDISHNDIMHARISLQRMQNDLSGLFTERNYLDSLKRVLSIRNLCTLYSGNESGRCILM